MTGDEGLDILSGPERSLSRAGDSMGCEGVGAGRGRQGRKGKRRRVRGGLEGHISHG